LDQRVFLGPPAEGVFVEVLLLVEQQAALPKLARNVFVGVLDPPPRVGGQIFGELAIASHRA
jgi:hypothetical protein